MKKFIQQIFGASATKKTNQLTAWVDDLADMSDLSALQFSTQQLAQLINLVDDADKLDLQQQYDLILTLEALNLPRLEKLSSQFSSLENMKPELENSMCETCYNHCRQAYIFQLKMIEKIADNHKTNQEQAFKIEGEQLTLLIARTLHTAFNMVKWRLFSQASPPAKVWLQINALYRFATQKMLLNNTVELFNLGATTSLSAFFVQTYMLGQLAQAGMQKFHIEIAARVMTALLTRARISDKFTPEHYLFFVDLDLDLPAKRMRDIQGADSCRYWELDELEKLLSVAITVSDRGEIPHNLAMAKIDSAKKLHETLLILYAEWKKTGYIRQRRKYNRRASSKTAKVNAGIVDICNQVNQANKLSGGLHSSASLDERLRLHTALRTSNLLAATSGTLDTWMITDESPQGLGARVNKYANILARPDKLIGLMIEDETTKIVIGMVRSVKPTQGNQLRVGIEIISHHPKWVQLKRHEKNEAFQSISVKPELKESFNAKSVSHDIDFFAGIYLPIEAGLSDTSCLILPKINFRANANYSVAIAGATQQVLLGDPIESHDDWVKVAFPF